MTFPHIKQAKSEMLWLHQYCSIQRLFCLACPALHFTIFFFLLKMMLSLKVQEENTVNVVDQSMDSQPCNQSKWKEERVGGRERDNAAWNLK